MLIFPLLLQTVTSNQMRPYVIKVVSFLQPDHLTGPTQPVPDRRTQAQVFVYATDFALWLYIYTLLMS